MTPINERRRSRRSDLDQVFRSLSHTVRRRILTALMSENPRTQATVETMQFRPEGRQQERVSLDIHHSHLPQLDQAGFVDWNPETGTVARGEKFEQIRPLLELMDEHRDELPDDWP